MYHGRNFRLGSLVPLVRLDIASMWPPLTRNRGRGVVVTTTARKGRPKSRVGSNPREALFRKNGRPKMHVSPLQCSKNHPKMDQKVAPPKNGPTQKSGPEMIGVCTKHLAYCDKMVKKKVD